jgi:hypothetical protein
MSEALRSLAAMAPLTQEGRDFNAKCKSRGWVDDDGLPIPEHWRPVSLHWQKLGFSTRSGHISDLTKEKKKADAPPRKAAKAFTTKAALDWGRKQGWILRDRERSTLTKTGAGKMVRRTHDILMGSDLMFEDPTGQIRGMILVQAGGKGERTPHFKRFEERGGQATCRNMMATFIYAEFVRGNPEPVLVETWGTPND